jgi:hypothetical protein
MLVALLLFVVAAASGSQSSESSLVAQALLSVISEASPDISTINVIGDSDDVTKAIANEVAARLSSEMLLIHIGDLDNVHRVRQKRFYNVILLAGAEGCRKLIRAVENERFDYQGFYLVAMTRQLKNQYRDMELMLQSMWQHSIINVNILLKVNDERLDMFTYYPFTSAHCGVVRPVRTDSFVNGSFTLSTSVHFGDKLKNLHTCPLKVVTFDLPPMMTVKRKADGKFSLSGIDAELLKGKDWGKLFRSR